MERNISPAGMVCIVLVAVASVIGISYATFAITKDSANEGNQEVVTQTEAVSNSWSSTYDAKEVTGNQVVSLLNDAESKGISVFVSTRGIERSLKTSSDTQVLKHNGKYYVNYGATYNYEDGSYGVVNGEASYTGNSALLQVRDGSSLRTDYGLKYDGGRIVYNKDFSAAYNAGSPSYIESTAKFRANLIYGADGTVTGVILSQSTRNTAATSLSFTNGSGAMGGTSGSYIPTHSNSGNIPLTSTSGGSGSSNGGSSSSTPVKVPTLEDELKGTETSKEEQKEGCLNQSKVYYIDDSVSLDGIYKVDLSGLFGGEGVYAVWASTETPSMSYLLETPYETRLETLDDSYKSSKMGELRGNLVDFGVGYYYTGVGAFLVNTMDNLSLEGLSIKYPGVYVIYMDGLDSYDFSVTPVKHNTFSIEGTTYNITEGMTWRAWTWGKDNNYGDEGGAGYWCRVDYPVVMTPDDYYKVQGVTPDDVIIPGKDYQWESRVQSFYIDGVAHPFVENSTWNSLNSDSKYGSDISIPFSNRIAFNNRLEIIDPATGISPLTYENIKAGYHYSSKPFVCTAKYNNVEFTFENGMTWGEFLDSDYLADLPKTHQLHKVAILQGYVYNKEDGGIVTEGSYVTPRYIKDTSVIKNNANYYYHCDANIKSIYIEDVNNNYFSPILPLSFSSGYMNVIVYPHVDRTWENSLSGSLSLIDSNITTVGNQVYYMGYPLLQRVFNEELNEMEHIEVYKSDVISLSSSGYLIDTSSVYDLDVFSINADGEEWWGFGFVVGKTFREQTELWRDNYNFKIKNGKVNLNGYVLVDVDPDDLIIADYIYTAVKE